MVMERSWNMKHWQEFIEFGDQPWNFTNFVPEFYQSCALLADITKFSIGLEGPHFLTLSTKCREGRL